MNHVAPFRMAGFNRNAPLRRRSPDKHVARRSTGSPQWFVESLYTVAAPGTLGVEHGIAIDLIDRRLSDNHIFPRHVQFFSEYHRQCGKNALPHFTAGYDNGD